MSYISPNELRKLPDAFDACGQPGCTHKKWQHYNGRGMCEGTCCSGFGCSCSRYKKAKKQAKNEGDAECTN